MKILLLSISKSLCGVGGQAMKNKFWYYIRYP
nr:MAG TPA: hypothetical protein [Caudoviricetes sp.]